LDAVVRVVPDERGCGPVQPLPGQVVLSELLVRDSDRPRRCPGAAAGQGAQAGKRDRPAQGETEESPPGGVDMCPGPAVVRRHTGPVPDRSGPNQTGSRLDFARRAGWGAFG